jgi:hypothetical protein
VIVEVLHARRRLEPQVQRLERRVDGDCRALRGGDSGRLDDVEKMEVVVQARERRAILANAHDGLAKTVGLRSLSLRVTSIHAFSGRVSGFSALRGGSRASGGGRRAHIL